MYTSILYILHNNVINIDNRSYTKARGYILYEIITEKMLPINLSLEYPTVQSLTEKVELLHVLDTKKALSFLCLRAA